MSFLIFLMIGKTHAGIIWGRWFKCNLSIPPPFIEKIAGSSIPINQGGRDYHVKLHFHLRPPLFTARHCWARAHFLTVFASLK